MLKYIKCELFEYKDTKNSFHITSVTVAQLFFRNSGFQNIFNILTSLENNFRERLFLNWFQNLSDRLLIMTADFIKTIYFFFTELNRRLRSWFYVWYFLKKTLKFFCVLISVNPNHVPKNFGFNSVLVVSIFVTDQV